MAKKKAQSEATGAQSAPGVTSDRSGRGPKDFVPKQQLIVPPMDQCDAETRHWAECIVKKCREDRTGKTPEGFDRITTRMAAEYTGSSAYEWGMAKAVARRELGVPLT